MNCPSHPHDASSDIGVSNVLGVDITHKACPTCGTGFADAPSEDLHKLTRKFYQSDFWDVHQGRRNKISLIKSLRSWTTEVLGLRYDYAHSYWSYFRDLIAVPSRILEVGSGSGNTLVFLEKKGHEVNGIEPDEAFVQLTNKRLRKGKVIQGYADQIPDQEYDVVMATHVLEHLIDPFQFLALLSSRLTPKSIVFFEVPNCANSAIMQDSVFNQPHLWHFTTTGLRGILDKAGFEVLKEGIYSPRYDPSMKAGNPLLFYLRKGLYQLAWVAFSASLFFPDDKGSVCRVVAKKKA